MSQENFNFHKNPITGDTRNPVNNCETSAGNSGYQQAHHHNMNPPRIQFAPPGPFWQMQQNWNGPSTSTAAAPLQTPNAVPIIRFAPQAPFMQPQQNYFGQQLSMLPNFTSHLQPAVGPQMMGMLNNMYSLPEKQQAVLRMNETATTNATSNCPGEPEKLQDNKDHQTEVLRQQNHNQKEEIERLKKELENERSAKGNLQELLNAANLEKASMANQIQTHQNETQFKNTAIQNLSGTLMLERENLAVKENQFSEEKMKLHSKIHELLAGQTRLEAEIGSLKEEKEKKIEAEKKAIMGIVMTGQACGLTILANPMEEASSNGAAKIPKQAKETGSTQIDGFQEAVPSSSTATTSLLAEAAPVAPTCSTSSNHHSESSACTTPDASSELSQTSAGSSGKVPQSEMWEAAVQNADTAPIYSDPMLFSLHCLFSATGSKDLPQKVEKPKSATKLFEDYQNHLRSKNQEDQYDRHDFGNLSQRLRKEHKKQITNGWIEVAEETTGLSPMPNEIKKRKSGGNGGGSRTKKMNNTSFEAVEQAWMNRLQNK